MGGHTAAAQRGEKKDLYLIHYVLFHYLWNGLCEMWETTKGNKMYLSGELEVWERTADELHLPPACPTIIIQSDTVKIKRWEKHNA